MDQPLEIDDLKTALRTLEAELGRHARRADTFAAESRRGAARTRLDPMRHGRLLQIAAGFAACLVAGAFWARHREVPHLLAAGLLVHAYGMLAIVLAACELRLLGRIDYAEPVVAIQRRLAELRRFHVRASLAAGLPWWLLWIAAALMLADVAGFDAYAAAPGAVAAAAAVGALGLAASLAFLGRARGPGASRAARFVDDHLAGPRLREARALLDAAARFELDA
ncbi:MAG TPA: serine/threonine protein kinase [Dokdonella sp.]